MPSSSATAILALFDSVGAVFVLFLVSCSMPGQTVADMDKGKMVNCLQTYVLHAECPFQWGSYNLMKNSQAASGVGLCMASAFLTSWLKAFPQMASAGGIVKFTDALDQLVATGAMSRFPVAHPVFEGLMMTDPKQRRLWVERAYAKVQCCLYHLRRLSTNETKRQQCLKPLSPQEREVIAHMLSLLPEKAAKKPPLPGAQCGLH